MAQFFEICRRFTWFNVGIKTFSKTYFLLKPVVIKKKKIETRIQ